MNQASEGVKAINVDDAPLPKSKNLNVLKEYKNSKAKKSVSFVVVGKYPLSLVCSNPSANKIQGTSMLVKVP